MTVTRTHIVRQGEPLVELHHVARRFSKRTSRNRSLQELFIRLFRKGPRDRSDEFWPLRDLSLNVYAGDCIGIIGPNGTGKSTLLKLITGILPPSRGDLIVRGRVSSLLELGAGFHPDLTGRENIYLNGSIYGLDRAAMDRRLDEIIAYAGLGDFIDTPVKHYSSGMYVRLGFAIAIHTDPHLLLVDEVLSVGDAVFQHRCMASIHNLRRQGITMILVSHDLGTVQSLCTRVLWIKDGLVAADGAPTDVIMQYLRHVAEEEERIAAQSGPTQFRDGTRWGTRDVEIVAVELCDAHGVPSPSFVTGAPMIVRLHYRRHRPVDSLIFGLGVHLENGTWLLGPNSEFAGVAIDLSADSGYVDYRVPYLSLLEGHYLVSVSAHNYAATVMYDYHDRVYPLRVAFSPNQSGYGLFDLQGTWTNTRLPEPAHPAPELATTVDVEQVRP